MSARGYGTAAATDVIQRELERDRAVQLERPNRIGKTAPVSALDPTAHRRMEAVETVDRLDLELNSRREYQIVVIRIQRQRALRDVVESNEFARVARERSWCFRQP